MGREEHVSENFFFFLFFSFFEREEKRARLFEEGAELDDHLVEAGAVPLHGRVVHLVHHNHQLRHAQRLRQLRVLPGLAAPLEARLKLAAKKKKNGKKKWGKKGDKPIKRGKGE